MLYGFLSYAEFIGILLLLTCFRISVHIYPIPLAWVALGVEEGSSHLSARQMLAVVAIIVLRAFVVVHFYQMPLHCILKVLFLGECIRAEQYLVLFRDVGPLQKSVAYNEADVL